MTSCRPRTFAAVAVLAIVLSASHLTAQSPRTPARLLGVFDPQGNALEDAEVHDLLTGAVARTSATGTVTLAFAASQHDSVALRIRKFGYRDTSFIAAVGAKDTTPITIVLGRPKTIAELTGVEVVADRNKPTFEGFAERCGVNSARTCFDSSALMEHPRPNLHEFIVHSTGVKRICPMGAPFSDCSVQMRPSVGTKWCTPDFYIDGFKMVGITLPDINKNWPPSTIKGMEVYEGDMPKPKGFESQCGVVVIWTK